MEHSHFIPQLGQSLTRASAEFANYRLLAAPGEYAVYAKQVSEHQTIYLVTAGPAREIVVITSLLDVATYATVRRKP
jgi:hypothetical protein